ncbi:MAG: hypothetical protein IT365_29470 [Candidatus Hydrogenedentes bacterium]|nr:hypothetical protein [Candidatus Hydrogenedentota bacterium]
MSLTRKDKEFLAALRSLMDERQLRMELKDDGMLRMVLRQNYGDRIQHTFGVTRQGVRWRFNHIFNEMYVNALVTLLLVESHFGTELRVQAMAVARRRAELYRKAQRMNASQPQRAGDELP